MSLPKVLLVDDHVENLVALEALLKDLPAELHRAGSGRQALELLLTHPFALAILDVRMPEMNGFELAELMRGTEKTRDIPIIFVTAATDTNFMFRGYEAGAVDVLYKPLDPRIVHSKVQVFLRIEAQKNQIEAQMQQLESALRIREEFLSIASHELKGPLSSMGLQIQFAQRELQGSDGPPPTELIGKTLSLAHRQVEKIAGLIDNLLDVSRIQAGQLSVNKSFVDVSKLVREVVTRMRPQLEKSGCPVTLQMQDTVQVPCEEFRVEQVLVNLLTNAAKYAPHTPVTVGLKKDGNFVVLTVQDEGPGIPAEKIEAVFDRFERVGQSGVSGLGLGLYIVRQIMRAHGGEISVTSKEGSGTTFLARFPL